MNLTIGLANKEEEAWARETAVLGHYLHSLPSSRCQPMTYAVRFGDEEDGYADEPLGFVMAGLPHSTKNKGWWGYQGLPTQYQVADLNRIWLSPRIQKGGDLCTPDNVPGFIGWRGRWWPAAGSWLIAEILGRIQRDRIAMKPPVYLDKPYHVRLVISYSDPAHHKGTIYKVAGATPMYTDKEGNPLPNASGKFGWCWRLPEPAWTWQELEILRPRTMRLAFA